MKLTYTVSNLARLNKTILIIILKVLKKYEFSSKRKRFYNRRKIPSIQRVTPILEQRVFILLK